jgi:hypothetical protein
MAALPVPFKILSVIFIKNLDLHYHNLRPYSAICRKKLQMVWQPEKNISTSLMKMNMPS